MKPGWIIAGLVCFLTIAGCEQPSKEAAQTPEQSEVQSSEIVRKIITLTADDGMQVPAVLTSPKSGINPYMPAILLHHGGPGGNPINFSGAPRFFAEGAAKAGYTSLSILSRHARFYHNTTFGDASLDIKAGLDFLSDFGDEGIILAGHSLGGIRVARYLAETDDPRVKVLIQFAPTRDLPTSMRSHMGEEKYLEAVASAKALIAAGKGKERVTVRYLPSFPNWPQDFKISRSHTAESFLDWWGPDAKTYNSRTIGDIKRPMLLLAGDADPFMSPTYLDELKEAATSSERVDTVWYKGLGHIFVEDRPTVIADTLDWLIDVGLGPRPNIQIDLVDAVSATGRRLSGVLYAPAGGEDKTKPVFLLLHGWSGDVTWSSNHWLGVRLAQAGYTSIAMRLRVSSRRGITTQPMETVIDDLGMWTDFAAGRGYETIVAEGHSAGGIWWTTYLNASKDERVKGMVYLAPTRNMADFARNNLGQETYDALVKTAQDAMAVEGGKATMISSDLLPDDKKRRFPFFQYADAFLSYWGPDAKTVHTQEVQKLDLPIFSIVGSKDGLVPKEFLLEFTEAAGPNASYVYYDDGAPHSLKGWEDRTAKDVVAWIQATIEP